MRNSRKNRRRTAAATIAIFLVVSVFVVKLVDIQVVRADALTTESLHKRSIAVTTYGARGDIVDTNGIVLADSVERFDITASPVIALAKTTFKRTIPGQAATVRKPLKEEISVDQALAELAGATGETVESLRAALEAKPNSDFAYLSRSADLDVLRKVQALNISWVYYERRPSRTYPNGAVAGNLVGFIGTEGPQAGLELKQDKCVASSDGSSTYERGADGVRLPGSTVTTKQATDGGTLKLTIDADFQWYVQQQIAAQARATGAKWATAVVVRVKDGHLMAVADYPSVDPNNVNGSKTNELGSLAFSTPYEPGSTFKAISAAMLIDAGEATPKTQVLTPNRLVVKGGTIKDVFDHGDMRWTTTGVLINSSNIGISLLTRKLPASVRYDYMRKFGVGERSAVGFAGESTGVLRAVKDWDPVTSRTVTFGQGVSATSIQVASVYQTLGNGGVKMPITLVEGCEKTDGTVTGKTKAKGTRVVSTKAANDTVDMLENFVTQGPLSQVLTIPDYNVAAKTGTAQVADLVNGGYKKYDRVVSVAGLVPGDKPEYAVVVTLGEPDTIKTSAAAAPTFTKIVSQVIKTFRVAPSSKKVPYLPATY